MVLTRIIESIRNMFFSKDWSPDQIPDLTGRIVIVTGGNAGLGFVTCKELARHGAKVYLACRVKSRAEGAMERIKREIPDAKLEFLYFDLTILSSAKKAAEEFLSKEDRLDILINNAAIMATPYELSPDGIELQACNGTGHFALTSHLIPILKKTDSTIPDSHVRIVNVSSLAHQVCARNPDFSSLEGLNKEQSSAWDRYGNSKLSNVLHTNELQKFLKDTNIYCLAIHPGLVATDLFNGTFMTSVFMKPFRGIIGLFLMKPEKGALTQLYGATSPEIETKKLKGAYLVPIGKVGERSDLAKDPDGILGRQFWEVCEKVMDDDEKRNH